MRGWQNISKKSRREGVPSPWAVGSQGVMVNSEKPTVLKRIGWEKKKPFLASKHSQIKRNIGGNADRIEQDEGDSS